MPTNIPPSRQLRDLIARQAWTETTIVDLLEDFMDAQPAQAEAIINYFDSRVDVDTDSCDVEPPPAEAVASVEDLDRAFGVQRSQSGDLLTFEQVSASSPQHVWTIVEGDDGTQWAQPGFHVVNRLGYITTERPWATGSEEFRFDD